MKETAPAQAVRQYEFHSGSNNGESDWLTISALSKSTARGKLSAASHGQAGFNCINISVQVILNGHRIWTTLGPRSAVKRDN